MRQLLLLALIPLLSGCIGGEALKSWEGRSASDLVYAWGPPDKQDSLPDGRRVLSYTHARQFEGTTMECEAMFRVDAGGIVRTAEADGNIGGCNRLLGSKPKAP